MLIGFIGCPCSGKTTTAALTFADLKSMGISSEFIPEQARMYIAEKRVAWKQPPGSPIKLEDDDQFNILLKQIGAEKIMLSSSGRGSIIITDTAALCTLLYMSPQAKETFRQRVLDHLPNYDLLFYCAPVKMPSALDANRVHDQEQALLIDQQIPPLLREYGLDPVFLHGDIKQRSHEVTKAILEKICG